MTTLRRHSVDAPFRPHALSVRLTLDAPPFDPEFVCGLGLHVPNCKVAVLHRRSDIVGYLAFAMARGEKIARPIPMCDYQPIILKIDSYQARMDGNLIQQAGKTVYITDSVAAKYLSRAD